MTTTVTGTPSEAVADALIAELRADSQLAAAVASRIRATTPETKGWPTPYIVGGRREVTPRAGAMTTEGGRVAVFLDFWSEANGPHEVTLLQSHARRVLTRKDLTVFPYRLISGSLVCEEETVFQDFDPDAPSKRLYHGIQKWVADAEEAA